MKKLILILFCVLAIVPEAIAQNANRRGAFVEVGAGCAIGTIAEWDAYGYNSSYDEMVDGTPYIKGGAVVSVDAGYRWPISRSFAIEAKAGFDTNLYDAGNLLALRILPGIRWTSTEFSRNKSCFVAFNPGFKLILGGYEDVIGCPIELGAGVNLTNQISIGLYYMGNVSATPDIKYVSVPYDKYGFYHADAEVKSFSNAVELKFGYRF